MTLKTKINKILKQNTGKITREYSTIAGVTCPFCGNYYFKDEHRPYLDFNECCDGSYSNAKKWFDYIASIVKNNKVDESNIEMFEELLKKLFHGSYSWYEIFYETRKYKKANEND